MRKLLLLALFASGTLIGAESTAATAAESQPTQFSKLPQKYPELSTFVSLVDQAQLNDLFVGTGVFTAFAPTNQAFEKLGKTKLDHLKKPENRDELSEILLYHVVPGKYMSKNLKSRQIPTIAGETIQIQTNGNDVTVNGAKILKSDIEGSNGVLHEIDTVLIPKNL